MAFRKTRKALTRLVWDTDLERQPPAKATLIRSLRIGAVVVRDLARGQLSLQAMGLVYTALLALIPLLAVTFSVLKAFGFHNQIEPLLVQLLAPLEDKGAEIARQILQFVSKMRVGVLGAVGFGMLIYTSVSLIYKIEQAINSIWHVYRPQRFMRRLGDYLTVVVIGPLLFFTAMGVTASLSSSGMLKPIHSLTTIAAKIVPYLLVIGAFAFVYVFLPNTKVRLRSALVGAVVAGVLWQSAGWLFTTLVVGSGQYRAVYASFAILIFSLIWMYLCWLILLVGASIAYYHQHPGYVTRVTRERSALLSNRHKERLGLSIARLIGNHYYFARPAWTADALAHALKHPPLTIEQLLASFMAHGLLAQTRKNPPTYLPTQPLETIPLSDVLHAIRIAGPASVPEPADPIVDAVMEDLARASADALSGHNWRDLVLNERTEMVEKIAAGKS